MFKIREAVDFMSAGKYTTVMHPKTRKLEKILKTDLKKYVMKGYQHMGPVKNRVTKSMFEEGQIAEAPEDNMPASPDEAGMAMDQAKFIAYVANEVSEYIAGNNEFPEWMQNKLTGFHEKAKDMHAVMAGKYESVEESLDEAAYKVPSNYAAIKARLNKKAKVTDTQINKVLGPTKNAQQGVEALKKAFKVNDDEAKAMIARVMPTEANRGSDSYRVKYKGDINTVRADSPEDALKKSMKAFGIGSMNKTDYMKNASAISEAVKITEKPFDEKLEVSDGLDQWIKDFQASDAPQFQDKDKEERRNMAIAAYLAAKRESKKGGKETEESTKAYGKSMDDVKKKHISDKDKKTLGKLADLMAKERGKK